VNTLRLTPVEGEALLLMPTRTVYWERTGTLFAAQLAYAGPADAPALERLQQAVEHAQPRRVIMLGSWFARRCESAPPLLRDWLARGIVLHQVDGQPTPLSHRLGVQHTVGPTPGPHFVLADRPVQPLNGFALGAYRHPVRYVEGQAVACFCFGARFGLLPSINDQQVYSLPLCIDQPSDSVFYAIVSGEVRHLSNS
jgi:hypothetical protein